MCFRQGKRLTLVLSLASSVLQILAESRSVRSARNSVWKRMMHITVAYYITGMSRVGDLPVPVPDAGERLQYQALFPGRTRLLYWAEGKGQAAEPMAVWWKTVRSTGNLWRKIIHVKQSRYDADNGESVVSRVTTDCDYASKLYSTIISEKWIMKNIFRPAWNRRMPFGRKASFLNSIKKESQSASAGI